jgi:hypothetical protein
MARFERLAPETFLKPQRPARDAYLAEYRSYLADLDVGEGGELVLEDGEKKATIKNRLKRAAGLEEKTLRFPRLRFQVQDPTVPREPKPTKAATTPAGNKASAPAAKKRGSSSTK